MMQMVPKRWCAHVLAGLMILVTFAGTFPTGADGAGGSFGGGDGTRANPYVIEDVWDLQNMSGDLDACYVLGNDIDASVTRGWNAGAGFEPVGAYANAFTGSLDGRNHTISGLYINRSGTANVGLFGYVDMGTVKDVGLINDEVTGDEAVGGLVGFSRSTVSNCYATGNVNGYYEVGGLMGHIQYRTVSNCYATGNVTGYGSVGGLVGLTYYTVSSCNATGNVTGYTRVGGLVGYSGMYGTVSNCYATGNVNGTLFVGGLVGEIATDTVSNCCATGNVTGYVSVGGLVGYTGTSQVTVSNCYATGNVTGSSGVGGLMGSNSCKVSNSFWDVESSGIGTSYGGTGRTTAEMRTRSTFTDAGWDFDDVWCIIENVTYPLLRWQDAGPPTARAGPDQTVDEGTNVTFDGSGSSDDLGIAEWAWTFVDGSPVTLHDHQPSHVFDDPGTFVVTLNVTDAVGRWAVDTVNVTVNDITAPFADAGPDLTVDVGDLVTFNGSMSTDDVGVANFTWNLTDGSPVTLYGIRPTYTFESPGVFVVTLRVADAAGNRDTDDMNVTVMDATPPVADARPNQTVDEGTAVTLDGSWSWDNVGIVNYTWTLVDGAPVTLFGARPTYTFDNPGEFPVTLNVTDGSGNWATDTMTVTVRDVTPPVAEAGPDQTVDEGSTVTFDGSASTDNVGIVSYTWQTVLGASDIMDLFGMTPSFKFNLPGIHSFTLFVRDAAGLHGQDTMTVFVRDTTPPVADAGPDQVVDEGTVVTFDGGSSKDLVGVTNWTWTFNDGTEDLTLQGLALSHTFAVPGVYVVTLRVSDAAGLWDTDTMTVTVRDTTPPQAVAGQDGTVAQGAPLVLSGEGSSDNVGVASYVWTFQDGGGPVRLEGSRVTYEFITPGTHTVTLTVSDLAGNNATDTVTFTVTDSEAPKASAGADATIQAGEALVLTALNSSDNVGIVSFEWRFVYGSHNVSLSGRDQTFRFEVAGTYEITLLAKDAAGNAGEDHLLVTVLPPESADGGLGLPWLLVLVPAFAIAVICAIVLFVVRSRKNR